VLIIANPAAGRARSGSLLTDRVIAALERRGCAVVLRRAGAALGDVERLAREAEPDFDVVVAAGGDGTVNAVVNGLAAAPRPLALLPLGTVNLLAREIGLPRHAEGLAAVIATAPSRPIWPARVGGRLFVSVASGGFDAEMVAAVDPRFKRRFGRLAFVWPILRGLWRYRASEISLRMDGIEHRAALVVVAKGRYYAGPFVAAPAARVADPVLHLVLLRRSGRLAVLRYLAALVLGVLPRLRDVVILRGAAARLSADTPGPVEADGEIVARLPVDIAVSDNPVPLLQP